MTIQLMIEELVLIPKIISFLALAGLILYSLVEYRQGHIGRLGIAGNAFLLWQIFFPIWATLPNWFQWYLNLGTIFAIIAISSYLLKNLFRTSLPTEFYQIAYYLYGSLSIIIALVIAIYLKIPLF